MCKRNMSITLRSLLIGTTIMLGVVALLTPSIAVLTRWSIEGPFYPDSSIRFADIDNDLVKIEGNEELAKGKVVFVKGRVLTAWLAPIPNARVEIWQSGANGRYIHPENTGEKDRDPAFQGFGHYITGSDGTYSFRTILPVEYVGRTPHIHV